MTNNLIIKEIEFSVLNENMALQRFGTTFGQIMLTILRNQIMILTFDTFTFFFFFLKK